MQQKRLLSRRPDWKNQHETLTRNPYDASLDAARSLKRAARLLGRLQHTDTGWLSMLLPVGQRAKCHAVKLQVALSWHRGHSRQRTFGRARPCAHATVSEAFGLCVLSCRRKGYFVQSGQCITVSAGEMIVYDTRKPYVFGFVSTTRQLLIDLPAGRFASCAGKGSAHLPLLLPALTGVESMLGTTLRATILQFLLEPSEYAASAGGIRRTSPDVAWLHAALPSSWCVEFCVVDVLLADDKTVCCRPSERRQSHARFNRQGRGSAHSPYEPDACRGRYLAERLHLVAKNWQTSHGPHQFPVTPLQHRGNRFRWGFSSQSHFSRVIHRRFGVTPTELRRERGRQHPAM
ncbi:MAG: hypothetical protein CBARDCOR_5463 [uncultured Caballeronia sp.]|nr:MAG: hypothetical protein CBARDCOR_5463 [uncultured Caballeronia sp.]